jgi:protein-S-isoprenylcysteine O-methyltransferase Ste14
MVSWKTDYLWQWHGLMSWIMNGIALLAIMTFIVTLKYYDISEFLGVRQFRENETSVEDQENFHLSPFHHFVRHPWYFLGIVLIWTRPMDWMMLVSAVAMTAYFIIGSKLEERKLISYHGDIYRKYINRVPAVFPLPWKYLPIGEKGKQL